MKRHLPVAVAFLVLAAGSVVAAETDWSGVYFGLNSGYTFSRAQAHYTAPAFSTYKIDSDPDGWSVGGQLGANYQLTNGTLDHVVLGLEVEFSYVHVYDTIYDHASDAHGRPDNSIKTSSDYAGTVRARLGYAVGRFLPYVTAGGAGTDAEVHATDDGLSQSDFLLGWTAGGGLEYAIDKNWSARIEYLYADFGRHTWFSGKSWESNSGLTSNTIRFGVNYRF
jgi:outer membrane immunogenic protein